MIRPASSSMVFLFMKGVYLSWSVCTLTPVIISITKILSVKAHNSAEINFFKYKSTFYMFDKEQIRI